jgi:hypothetical protein
MAASLEVNYGTLATREGRKQRTVLGSVVMKRVVKTN